jgi:hypothetical protein
MPITLTAIFQQREDQLEVALQENPGCEQDQESVGLEGIESENAAERGQIVTISPVL